MLRPVLVECDTQRERWRTMPTLESLTPILQLRHRPDAQWMLVDADDEIAACCSLWWSDTPAYDEHRVGFIGHYAAHDRTAGRHLLEHACRELADRGCTLAVGPVDGNTWQRYRLVVERGTEPPFFLEPDHPDDWPAHFQQAGFSVLARYTSMVLTARADADPRLPRVAQRFDEQGVTIRPVNLDHFEEELRRIYRLALISFRKNVFFQPIPEGAFLEQYLELRSFIHPELCLMAEHAGQLVGFCFTLPNVAQAQRDQPIDSVVVKTIAVLPARAVAGLGTLLFTRCVERARALGYQRCYLALMHERNQSQKLARRHQPTIVRRYALFANTLETQP